MKTLMTITVLTMLATACGKDSDKTVGKCQVSAPLSFANSQINANGVSTLAYESTENLSNDCYKLLAGGVGQGYLKVVAVENSNASFRFQGIAIGAKSWSFANLLSLNFDPSTLYDGWFKESRDAGKNETTMAAEQSLRDSLRMPLEISSTSKVKISAQVTGTPANNIVFELQSDD